LSLRENEFVSDAIAAPIQGALRGYKDVNVTLINLYLARSSGLLDRFDFRIGSQRCWSVETVHGCSATT